MVHLLRKTARAAGSEIDDVIEGDAGLRSVRDAARILGLDAASVVDLLEQDTSPNAYRTTDIQPSAICDCLSHPDKQPSYRRDVDSPTCELLSFGVVFSGH